VSVWLERPLFQGASKESICNHEAGALASRAALRAVEAWFAERPDEAKTVCERIA
jgi:hypothetical protein